MCYGRQLLTFPPTKRRLCANVQPKALRQGQSTRRFHHHPWRAFSAFRRAQKGVAKGNQQPLQLRFPLLTNPTAGYGD